MSDMVNSPAHYQGNGEIECMDAMDSMFHGYAEAGMTIMGCYWAGSVLKYLWRAPLKNGAQDVDKAIRCLEYLKEEIEALDE